MGIGALFFGIWLWTAFPFSTSAQAEQPAVSADPIEQAVASKQKSVASTKKAVTSVNKIMGKMAKIHLGGTSLQNQAKPQGLTPAKSPPAQTASTPTPTPTPNQAKSPPAQTASTPSPAVGSEAVTDSSQSAPLNHNKSTSPPSAKSPVKAEGALPAETTTNKAPQDLAQQKAAENRAPASDNLPVPPPPAVPEGNPPPVALDEDFNTKLKSAQELTKQKGTQSAETANELMGVNQKVVKIYQMLSAFDYDPEDKRDPFVPFRPKGMELKEEEMEVFQHATSEYELSEIKLIGMKWGKGPNFSKAMFRTPDNEIHYLQAKDRIGNSGAIIDRLKEDKVVVLEPRFAVEAQSRSANSGPKRVFVPKIIHISRFKNPVRSKEEEAVGTAVSSNTHSTSLSSTAGGKAAGATAGATAGTTAGTTSKKIKKISTKGRVKQG